MNIWDFQTRLTRRLLAWSALSVVFSILMVFSGDPFLRGVGIQCLVWGIIDAGIAFYGAKASTKKRLEITESEKGGKEARESRWLSRVLWVNTGLDILYVMVGVWLMQSRGAESPLWRGHGLGVVIQGGFLFLFDFFHATALRTIRKS